MTATEVRTNATTGSPGTAKRAGSATPFDAAELRSRRPYDRVKRVLDVLVAAVALLATAPLQAVVALLVRTKLGSPVLFRQQRPGKDEELFELVKFRTMLEPDPGRGIVTDEQRLTPFGRRLRSTSLDELPTLINVLRGEMSLVGPRPLLVAYLDRYDERERQRHLVRPGVTGLAQVSGRNAISWDEKFDLDLRYVRDRALRLDLRVLALTFGRVLRRDGITSATSSTMEEFTGSRQERSDG